MLDKLCLILITTSIILGCNSAVRIDNNSGKYLFIAHTYITDTFRQRMDPRVERLRLDSFDLVFLGGDITELTTIDTQTLYYVDSVFDLQNEKTHWAIGNHDNSNPDYIKKFTKKPLNYAFYKLGGVFIVLNSEEGGGRITDNQLQLVNNVCDTLRESGYIVIVTHKLLWLYGDSVLSPLDSLANGQIGGESWEIHANRFQSDIVPKLESQIKTHKQVICIAGDIGINTNRFEFRSASGINYLASGLSRKIDSADNVLILNKNNTADTLWWSFTHLDEDRKSVV